MEINNQHYNDSEIARAYIRNLADNIEDPEEMLMFLSACDKAQAALVYCLFKEMRYVQLQLAQTREVQDETKSHDEIDVAWNDYRQASVKFELAKECLKKIIYKILKVNP